jgi:uncharacterized coiled-coil DUF342 family protein
MASESHIDDPGHWRNRAEEMRQLADQASNQQYKNEMLAMAQNYDHLADRAEERAKDGPPSK